MSVEVILIKWEPGQVNFKPEAQIETHKTKRELSCTKSMFEDPQRKKKNLHSPWFVTLSSFLWEHLDLQRLLVIFKLIEVKLLSPLGICLNAKVLGQQNNLKDIPTSVGVSDHIGPILTCFVRSVKSSFDNKHLISQSLGFRKWWLQAVTEEDSGKNFHDNENKTLLFVRKSVRSSYPALALLFSQAKADINIPMAILWKVLSFY